MLYDDEISDEELVFRGWFVFVLMFDLEDNVIVLWGGLDEWNECFGDGWIFCFG